MKRIFAVLAGIVLLLAGCGASSGAEPTWPTVPAPFAGEFAVADVKVGERTVTCVVWDGYRAGGISCDWANAK